jgi:hypothetical protein
MGFKMKSQAPIFPLVPSKVSASSSRDQLLLVLAKRVRGAPSTETDGQVLDEW